MFGHAEARADETPRIKKAYRRKALELHPDRNYHDVENATRLFAEVQTAHEVLSDPQERAWYDSHRETILRNDGSSHEDHFEHNIKITSADEIISLIGKFNSSIAYTNAPTGFYGVLRNLFNTLSDEEDAACDWEGLEVVDRPSFGGAEDGYEDVVRPFYSSWMGFATKKTFAWKDLYRYSEAPDRRVRRMMEKENKRFREEGIREFNEAVRALVAFVRKRDPRYIPNTQSEAERQKILRDAAAAQAMRSRAANQAKIDAHIVPEWTRSHEAEEEVPFSESEESEVEEIGCVICNKTFKSERQFEAHEKSKKHVKAVQQLKRQMQKENKLFNLDDEYAQRNGAATPLDPSMHDSLPLDTDDRQADGSALASDDGSLEGRSEREPEDDDDAKAGNEKVDEHDLHSPLNGTFQTKQSASPLHSVSVASDDEYATREEVESRIMGDTKRVNHLVVLDSGSVDHINGLSAGTSTLSLAIDTPKLGKAKAKRAKKAAQQEKADQAATEVGQGRTCA